MKARFRSKRRQKLLDEKRRKREKKRREIEFAEANTTTVGYVTLKGSDSK